MLVRSLIEGGSAVDKATAEKLFGCTLCKACEVVCPAGVQVTGVIPIIREQLLKMGVSPLLEHLKIARNIAETGNLFGYPRALREATFRRKIPCEANVLYFAGCVASYGQPNVVRSTERILEVAGVNYTTLGAQENCCGSFLFKIGQSRVAETVARENSRRFRELKVKVIVTSCADCYWMLKVEYPKRINGFDFEVLHLSEFIEKLLDERRLKLTKKILLKVTYQDPCYLGRHLEVYEPPRRVLENVPGIRLVEMEHTRRNAICCGAGSGVSTAFKALSLDVATLRLKEAVNTDADLLVTGCPFCYANLSEAAERACLFPLSDLAEIVANAI